VAPILEVDMAIVRRVVGRAAVPSTVDPVFEGAIPHQAGPIPGQEMAAAVTSPPAKIWSMLAGFGLTGVGAVAAWNINQLVQPTPFQVGSTTAVFGALFVFAAAVERLIEPVTRWMPGRDAQARYERAVADMDNGVPGAIHAAAYHKAAADSGRSARAVITWGLATALATVLSASAGFYLLRSISATPGWNGVAPWVDALVTGLVVGSGTKPLHDLFVRAQPN
jgi:hypothetical protein